VFRTRSKHGTITWKGYESTERGKEAKKEGSKRHPIGESERRGNANSPKGTDRKSEKRGERSVYVCRKLKEKRAVERHLKMNNTKQKIARRGTRQEASLLTIGSMIRAKDETPTRARLHVFLPTYPGIQVRGNRKKKKKMRRGEKNSIFEKRDAKKKKCRRQDLGGRRSRGEEKKNGKGY